MYYRTGASRQTAVSDLFGIISCMMATRLELRTLVVRDDQLHCPAIAGSAKSRGCRICFRAK